MAKTEAKGPDPGAPASAETMPPEHDLGGLVTVPQDGADDPAYISQIERTLEETKEAVLNLAEYIGIPEDSKTWDRAKEIISSFRPVPWFIWRLSNYVFSTTGQIKPINEGLVLGLRRLLFAAASDDVLGSGDKINEIRQALKILPPDAAAAAAVIHGICRRFRGRPFERIWSPILDDALLRARIGWSVGGLLPEFGRGRGMLAGFAGRSGLAILLASGGLEEAQKALELMAMGAEIAEVGLKIYRCDPLQVSALALSASGCGRDAAFGTVSFAVPESKRALGSAYQEQWLAAFAISDALRMGTAPALSTRYWSAFKADAAAQEQLAAMARKVSRGGHGWSWLL